MAKWAEELRQPAQDWLVIAATADPSAGPRLTLVPVPRDRPHD